MAIRAKADAVRTGASVVARSRTRRPIKLEGPCTLATYVVDLSIHDTDRLLGAALVVGQGRGLSADETFATLHKDGALDIETCLTFLLSEAMTALASATGATVGTPEVFVEEMVSA